MPPTRECFDATESCARRLDDGDLLRAYRERFHIPPAPDGTPTIYFCGNSLGLQPKSVRDSIDQELNDWARLAVDAHFDGRNPWFAYHEFLREPAARLVGALPQEVVMMNGLTVNLHLMMVSFYRPTAPRFRILIEEAAFPSDIYAVQTQLVHHGFDPTDGLLVVQPRAGEHTVRTEDLLDLIEREGDSIVLILLGGVNYFSGQWFDLPRIAAAGHAKGCTVGFDLAHAAGNVPLSLHDWNVDFAAWCTYKYLNCGPGSVAGAFVHERHVRDPSLPRFGGWWGNDPKTRFRMHLNERFEPVASADAWQLSNPPILSMAALRASLAIFEEVGMGPLREKSERMIAYMTFLLDRMSPGAFEVITPRDPGQRGCQTSILVHGPDPQALQKALHAAGVVSDFRPPNVVRVAPVPLYNTFHEIWRFARVLDGCR